MSSARRPLLTATAAGTLLCALWFVPSANASQDGPARATEVTEVTGTTQVTQQAKAISEATTADAANAADSTQLADTGSFDTTPYVVGGSLFLAVGAGFVVYSVRRERLDF
ncbi:LAETG motif-containing sortase-dependent surface protein [Streptomyces diastatochromogenes]|uniref:LAETG motif-containing sortase-dependent surface protein n=1 Tax=Streptomyces diastatochromogenes TaxID=42236 RepID=UPI0036BC73A1